LCFAGALLTVALLATLVSSPPALCGTKTQPGLGALPNDQWYFAEGTTRPGFDEWLTLQNPGDDTARATITFMMSDGYNQDKVLDLPRRSRTTLSVREVIGSDRDASAKVTADRPIVAERPMYFDYSGGRSGGACAVGATGTSKTWYFAEGTTREGFDEYLCLLNPGEAAANVHIEYMTPGRVNYFQDVTVDPRSRKTVRVSDVVPPGEDIAAMLSSNNAIVAERPMYFLFKGSIPGGDDVMGVPTPQQNWYFAEGFTSPEFWTYVCLQNPGKNAAVVLLYYLLADGRVLYDEFTLEAKSRITVDPRVAIGDAEFSLVIDSSQPVVAERAMYFAYKGIWAGGHNVTGAAAPAQEAYFAEGTTLGNFEEWLCIMNPNNDAVDVDLEFQVEGSSPVRSGYRINAHSRYTVNVNDTVGLGKNVSLKATAGAPIVIERPMYFDYGGGWPGGHCVMGFTP
jgi:hypothetical protein